MFSCQCQGRCQHLQIRKNNGILSSNNDFRAHFFACKDVGVIFKSMANLFIIGVSVVFKVQVANISILILIKLIIQI